MFQNHCCISSNSSVLWWKQGNYIEPYISSNEQQHQNKTLDTFGNCQRPIFSLSVSQQMHEPVKIWAQLVERKTPRHTKLCAFICLISRPQNLILTTEVSKSNLWKITSFSKTTLLQREPFLTMFLTTPHYSLPSEVLCL